MATLEKDSHSEAPLVIVVGAGLGGLSAAVAIALAGHYRVLVLEAASKLGEIGAGIQLSSNCSKLLIRWGCAKYLEPNVVAPHHGRVCRWQDGEILTDRIMNPTAEEKFGAPYWHIHRADLHQGLLDRARELGVELRTNAPVTKVQTGDGETSPGVTLESGETFECIFVVGADGIHSKIRTTLFPGFEKPRPTGDLAYRFRVATADMLEDETLKPLAETPDTHSWWGPGKHIVGYMLRGKQMYNVITLFPDDGSLGDATRGTGTSDHLKEIYDGWCPKYRKPRATKIQMFSRDQRARNHLPDGPEQRERDALLKNPDQQTKSHVWTWDEADSSPAGDWVTGLHGYDAEHEAVKAIRSEGLAVLKT
ncbi:unnamed protein product [Clonostachys byssicola]|uniref:FAD-binding domain-containing protein n=1 Tax=Clonostachys byssicola TaxID=160290 RepID=A0A9N9TZQ1_9HYPO|nr:unnamed protein product [Clonostachys byssicola]